MLALLRLLSTLTELLISLPFHALRVVNDWVVFNPRLGPLRHVIFAAGAYAVLAVLLVYIVAPVRGFVGGLYQGEKLRYDAERWLATAIYDKKGTFAGTFDARLDSLRDVNYTDAPIEVDGHVANPDHKSIPVKDIPPFYWQCLVYHEDRYIGGALNPFGIDLLGVLKIPVSTVQRSIALRRPSFGVGGSTLPMQFARVIYNTPPNSAEGGLTKLGRKLSEWWLAPVIYHQLTKNGDDTPLKQWAANHLWLAQRTGGAPLHGVEITSRVVFGKDANELSIAEQFVLASAVNKPIILLEGSARLNEVRLDRWRYITEVRARTCAERLLTDDEQKKKVLFELIELGSGPPDPKVKPKVQEALETYAPSVAKRAEANPVVRANALMPSARFGLREEMKQEYGFGWREYVRGVTTTFEATTNLAFDDRIKAILAKVDADQRAKITPGYTLDPAHRSADQKMPNVIVVAANSKGEIVRYYEAGETASYFGAPIARDPVSGAYIRDRDPRMIASTGKIIAAIAIANSGRDASHSLYLDAQAPASGLETCAKGSGRAGRQAIVAFACSLNAPLLNRTALAGQHRVQKLIDGFGFNMPPPTADGEPTPPSTAVVLGQISGAPRRVHHMSAVVLASLLGRGATAVKEPSLVSSYDFTAPEHATASRKATDTSIVPNKLIRREAVPLLRNLLSAPLCYQVRGTPAGTLKSLSRWCASRRGDVRFHFAKTGTQVTTDPNATVDVWITGGLQFANGAAYSYVVLAGTGSASEPWATSLHAAQVAAPLLDTLLSDLAGDAKQNPAPWLLPSRSKAGPIAQNPAPAIEGALHRSLGAPRRQN